MKDEPHPRVGRLVDDVMTLAYGDLDGRRKAGELAGVSREDVVARAREMLSLAAERLAAPGFADGYFDDAGTSPRP